MQVRATKNPEDFGKCGCGRSPTGYCVGFHGLSDQDWAEGKNQLVHNLLAGRTPVIEDMTDEARALTGDNHEKLNHTGVDRSTQHPVLHGHVR
jgi:hypothetical protein